MSVEKKTTYHKGEKMFHSYIYILEHEGIIKQLNEKKIPYFIPTKEEEIPEKIRNEFWHFTDYKPSIPKQNVRLNRSFIEVDISEEEFETLRRNCYPGHADKKEG